VTHPASLDTKTLLGECDVRFTRRSGPGGQNRNKVETAAILTHRPTGTIAEANERRSQSENRDQALFRLRLKLALEIRTARSVESVPSPLWRSRSKGGRLTLSPHHEDFPGMLAEAMDVLELEGGDVRAAAERLDVSTTQLTRFLKDEPRAIIRVNEDRRSRGLHPLH